MRPAHTRAHACTHARTHAHARLYTGPEALTGSTRMKGGSATKIILEIIITLGLERERERVQQNEQQQKEGGAAAGGGSDGAAVEVARMLGEYESTVRSTYLSAAKIASLVELAGASLKAGGHVYYLGTSYTRAMRDCARVRNESAGLIVYAHTLKTLKRTQPDARAARPCCLRRCRVGGCFRMPTDVQRKA